MIMNVILLPVLCPLLGSLIAGFFGKIIGNKTLCHHFVQKPRNVRISQKKSQRKELTNTHVKKSYVIETEVMGTNTPNETKIKMSLNVGTWIL